MLDHLSNGVRSLIIEPVVASAKHASTFKQYLIKITTSTTHLIRDVIILDNMDKVYIKFRDFISDSGVIRTLKNKSWYYNPLNKIVYATVERATNFMTPPPYGYRAWRLPR